MIWPGVAPCEQRQSVAVTRCESSAESSGCLVCVAKLSGLQNCCQESDPDSFGAIFSCAALTLFHFCGYSSLHQTLNGSDSFGSWATDRTVTESIGDCNVWTLQPASAKTTKLIPSTHVAPWFPAPVDELPICILHLALRTYELATDGSSTFNVIRDWKRND